MRLLYAILLLIAAVTPALATNPLTGLEPGALTGEASYEVRLGGEPVGMLRLTAEDTGTGYHLVDDYRLSTGALTLQGTSEVSCAYDLAGRSLSGHEADPLDPTGQFELSLTLTEAGTAQRTVSLGTQTRSDELPADECPFFALRPEFLLLRLGPLLADPDQPDRLAIPLITMGAGDTVLELERETTQDGWRVRVAHPELHGVLTGRPDGSILELSLEGGSLLIVPAESAAGEVDPAIAAVVALFRASLEDDGQTFSLLLAEDADRAANWAALEGLRPIAEWVGIEAVLGQLRTDLTLEGTEGDAHIVLHRPSGQRFSVTRDSDDRPFVRLLP